MESCLCRPPLRNTPNSSGKDTENHHDRAKKDHDLLQAQTHCGDRITDPPKPAKLKIYCESRCLAPKTLVLHIKVMVLDAYKRPVRDLRISVTDRCNFRCIYCMPLDEYEWIIKSEILVFEVIDRLATLALLFGVEKIWLSGAEPLVRHHFDRLICKFSTIEGLKDLCLTTNGALLAEQVDDIKH